jgi:hypothetical protein
MGWYGCRGWVSGWVSKRRGEVGTIPGGGEAAVPQKVAMRVEEASVEGERPRGVSARQSRRRALAHRQQVLVPPMKLELKVTPLAICAAGIRHFVLFWEIFPIFRRILTGF